MMYKRAFGKKGLVAAIVPQSVLNDKDFMMRFEGACIQCGITQDYAIDVLATTAPADSSEEREQVSEFANHVLVNGYRAVITAGDSFFNLFANRSIQLNKDIMHLGLGKETFEQDPTFRMRNMDPIFEKNISEDDRMYVIDRLSPEQIEQRRERRRKAAREEAMMTSGFVGVVGPDGHPSVIRVPGAEPDDDGEIEEEIFEA